MAKVVADLPDNKSEKMRALSAAGFTRAQIATFLDVRYQFVRNVLVAEQQKASEAAAGRSGMRDDAREFSHKSVADPDFAQAVTIDSDGRLQLPQLMMEAAGMRPGETVLVRFGDNRLELSTRAAALARTREEIRKYVPQGVSLVDDLVKERRREVDRERNGA
jgi:DNA-binding transcriptional regulator/RsmH inhibitor MraZ